MEILATYSNYQQFKQALDYEMQKTVEGFVKIGYLLSYASETNIVEQGGYANVNEFAKAEYNIDATQVSRFVNIYNRFGVPGEARLQDQYANHGVAKLGIMLTLPNAVNKEISENYSKSEITAIKREIEAEQKISDIEVEIERKEMEDSIQYSLPEGLKQAVYQLIHDEPKLYLRIFNCIELDDLKEILAPMGEASYIVRIKGVGRLSIFLKAESNIALINLRENTKVIYEWHQLFDVLKEYFAMGEDAKSSWSNVFWEPYPEEKHEEPKQKESKNDTAPHKDNVEKPKPKKEMRVKVVEPKKEEKIPSQETEKEVEEQLPGQKSIVDYPEYLPDSMKEDKPEVIKGEVVEVENSDNDNVQQDSEGMKVEYIAPVQNNDKASTIRGYKAGIKAALAIAQDKCEQGDWSSVIAKATDIVWRAKKIQELEAKN